jgi:hypothetical protein
MLNCMSNFLMEKLMKPNLMLTFIAALALSACASAGKDGDACTTDDDCEDGLECHIEDHDDHGDEDEEEHEDEEGTCEEQGADEDE